MPTLFAEQMQDARAAAGGARGEHLGHRGRGPQHKDRRCGHPGLRAGEGDAGSFSGRQRSCHDQAGAMSGCVRRSFLPGVQVSAVAIAGSLSGSVYTRPMYVDEIQMWCHMLLCTLVTN